MAANSSALSGHPLSGHVAAPGSTRHAEPTHHSAVVLRPNSAASLSSPSHHYHQHHHTSTTPHLRQDDPPWRVLRERYLVCRCLHKGPNSTVVAALQRGSRRQCAVKIVSKRTLSNRAAQLAVAREVSLLARLDHPNLVRFVDAFENREAVFIATEYCTCDLFAYLARTAAGLAEREALQLIRQILVVVDFLHEHNVAHRDIKLENIMLTGLNQGVPTSPSSPNSSDDDWVDDDDDDDDDVDHKDDDEGEDEKEEEENGSRDGNSSHPKTRRHHRRDGGCCCVQRQAETAKLEGRESATRPQKNRRGRPSSLSSSSMSSSGSSSSSSSSSSSPPASLSSPCLNGSGQERPRRGCPVVKLTDFGLSYWRAPDATELKTRQRSGTPFYAAPEVLEVSDRGYVPERADLWSCGVVLYALLTRRLPFQGRTYGELRRTMSAPHLQQLLLGVPCAEATRDVLRALLCLEADGRPTAQAAVAMVDHALHAVDATVNWGR